MSTLTTPGGLGTGQTLFCRLTEVLICSGWHSEAQLHVSSSCSRRLRRLQALCMRGPVYVGADGAMLVKGEPRLGSRIELAEKQRC